MEAIVDGDREELDYGTFGVATRQLCQQVVDSGFEPDWIVAIARGGLLIGGAVAYALRCKNIGVVNVEFYTDIDERLEVPVMLPPALNLADLADTKLLIVVDTCAPVVAEIRSLVIYEKPRSIFSADYVWRHTDQWINFPWSSEPPLR